MPSPNEILESGLAAATTLATKSAITSLPARGAIDYICRCVGNRAGVRLLLACMLAKVEKPKIDPRKPYTEIGGKDSFSGRVYDEKYLSAFITKHRLPCNPTTAFLTPALRNQNTALLRKVVLQGSPPELYSNVLDILDQVARGQLQAKDVLTEVIRVLILFRNEKSERINTLTAALKVGASQLPLATEEIVTLLRQHLACRHSSRLPVLVVAAAYKAAEKTLGKHAVALRGHLAADLQTGATGDVEVCFTLENRVCTIYEMKAKRVTIGDVDVAVEKIVRRKPKIDNYIFITTEAIESAVAEYAAEQYELTFGTEIAILDCIGFARHFLHLFHQLRAEFLDCYQDLLIAEPDSAVSQELREVFLTLRQAAQADS